MDNLTNIYGTSFTRIDSKNRLYMPARFQIEEGSLFGFIKEDNSMVRVYLYNQLLLLYESLQRASYSQNSEENKIILEKVCTLLTKAGEPRSIDKIGRITLPPDTLSEFDGFPLHKNVDPSKKPIAMIGEGSGFSIVSNEKAFDDYSKGKYGCNLDSYARIKG